ncbi:centriolar satellite-associated tubulin polyglutamylase complex regulator 1 isoform X2 [Manis javanica]|uniref:centriolar satellite-associated tubulin polyglutamylase complex regulator 1 isoform X2 n=1 Tax=Manis javanica TaxID=9974 RepID=UPI003C6D3BDE
MDQRWLALLAPWGQDLEAGLLCIPGITTEWLPKITVVYPEWPEAQQHVLTYMEDAVCQLLENKEDISQHGIARFFTEYFNSVCQGTHVLFREFSFIQATPHNRASFLKAFWRCFQTVGKNGDLLTMREYHCLLQLLCPDFPLELTQKAARIVLMDDAMDCLMSFSDFLFAFQIQFYYSEFLESVAAIYQDLLSGKSPNTVIVPTSSSGQHRQRPPLSEASMLEGVEASLFFQCLENLCDRHKYSCPPLALVKEVLSNVQRLTFYGFLVSLSKHHGINQALGALPDKGNLMHDPAMDEELERLVTQRLSPPPSRREGARGGGVRRPQRSEDPDRANSLGVGEPQARAGRSATPGDRAALWEAKGQAVLSPGLTLRPHPLSLPCHPPTHPIP